jgi:tetratricopeptide (TPR) repeat protein
MLCEPCGVYFSGDNAASNSLPDDRSGSLYDEPAVTSLLAVKHRRRPVAASSKRTGDTSIRSGLLALAIVLGTFLAYLPALQAGFVWDDDDYVTENRTLREGDGLLHIWLEPTSIPQYYPMVHTTYWIEYQLWEKDPRGYHAVNIGLHAFAALLLWQVLSRLGVPGAWLAAAVFAVHPVHAESVVWITERKNVLSAVFYLAALLSYLRLFGLQDDGAKVSSRWRLYALGTFLFVLALLSKSITCSLPAVILLLVWWKRGRLERRDFLHVVPLFVIGVAAAGVTVYLEKVHVGAEGQSWELTFVQRLLIAGRALWFYTGKLVWPAQLTFIYPRWDVNPSVWWQWVPPLSATVAVSALWFERRRIGRGPLVAVLIFAGTLVPALGFFDYYPMRYSFVADHFQYLASASLIALFVAVGTNAVRRLRPGMLHVGTVGALIVLAVFGAGVWRQARVYRDLPTLWSDVLAKNPGAWMAHNNLGQWYFREGQPDKALTHYRASLEIEPGNPTLRVNLSQLYWSRGQRDEAMTQLREALRLDPESAQAHHNLGVAYTLQGDVDRAIEHFRQALRSVPDYLEAHEKLGRLLAGRGEFEEAIHHFGEILRIEPEYWPARQLQARALWASGRTEQAIPAYTELLQREPEQVDALRELAWILATHPDATYRDGARAVELSERAARLTDHREPRVLDTLAAGYAAAGRFEQMPPSARHEQIQAIRLRLQLYEQRRPYHSSPQDRPKSSPGD